MAKRLRKTLPKGFSDHCFDLHGKWTHQDIAKAEKMLEASEPTARE